jgi:pantoate--beta-alanine ligase
MRTFRTVAEVRAARSQLQGPLGLVPTMGYLHQGHLSLVQRARTENAHVAVWIFVNPTQFGPHEDFERYPRNEAGDAALLEAAGVDLLFAPPVAEIYPPGHATQVVVSGVTERLEGAVRPGHFTGVATVVAKFFNILTPQRAYFGQKDAQQVVVVRRMVADLDLPVAVVACPTVREADGLAMSSRNAYLDPRQRAAAPVLYQALCRAQALWDAGGRDGAALRQAVTDHLATEPLARPEYVSLADPDTLLELERATGPALLSLAVRIGPARLIDNLVLGG